MNILIIKHGSLGDLIISFRALNAIRIKFKKDHIFLLTEKKYLSLFGKIPYVNQIVTDDRKNIFYSTLRVISILRNKKINLIIDLQNSSRTEIYNFFIRFLTKTKILSARKFSNFDYKQKKFGIQHISKNHEDQLKFLGINNIPYPDMSWLKTSNEYEKAKYAVIIPGSSQNRIYARLPEKIFAEICNYLISKKIRVFLTGSYLDEEVIKRIIELCPEAENKIPESEILNFYSLCNFAKIIVSNDTGPAHLAGLTNNNLIWVTHNYKHMTSSYPLGSNVHKIYSKNLKKISSNFIINKMKTLLK